MSPTTASTSEHPGRAPDPVLEGTWRSHPGPLSATRSNPAHLAQLETWLRRYRPQELFTPGGALRPELAALPPTGQRRMSASPHTH